MIKISLLRFYLTTFILSVSLYSVGNTENEFSIDPAITYGKLENGLTYYIRENQTPKDKVSIKLIIKAGSVMEEENQLGLAHLLEHMAFNGSKNFPKRKIDEYKKNKMSKSDYEKIFKKFTWWIKEEVEKIGGKLVDNPTNYIDCPDCGNVTLVIWTPRFKKYFLGCSEYSNGCGWAKTIWKH